jgi:DNA-binding IclR family transcriptional regulator
LPIDHANRLNAYWLTPEKIGYLHRQAQLGSPKRKIADFQKGTDSGQRQFVTALARGIAILSSFRGNGGYLGNQEIARLTRLPKATVSRLTFTLTSLGFLVYSATLEKYALGTSVLTLAEAFVRGSELSLARPLMEKLADQTKAAVMLGAFDGSHMVLLDICQGDDVFRLRLQAGSRVPHHSTALGRAFWAAKPRAEFDGFLDSLQAANLPETWHSAWLSISRARRDYERLGFCFSLGDWNPDLFAVGVPLVSHDKSRIFAFNVSGRVSVVTRERILEDIGPKLVSMRDKVLSLTEGRF